MHGIFGEISLVIVLAGVLGMAMHFLRQPPLVGYILTGLILGPLGYLHLNNVEVIDSLSHIGITLLLFMVGLELSVRDLKQIGWTAVAAAVSEMIIVAVIAIITLGFFDVPLKPALYLGLGVTFSSTILAVKLLTERKDLDSLYGKLTLGILIVEDIVAILALAFIASLDGSATGGSGLLPVLLIGVKLIGLFAIAVLLSKKLFPWIAEKLAQSSELIFLFSLAWGLGFATLISDQLFGLSAEIGGFLAGLTLANSSQHVHIASRMRPLRDFFLILFFIVLGSQFIVQDFEMTAKIALILLAIGIIIKPLFLFILLSIAGFRGRTSFLTASSLAHISEFSIILAVIGHQSGVIDRRILAIVILATIASFLTGSYAFKHSFGIATSLRKLFSWLDAHDHIREKSSGVRKFRGHAVLIGANRTGSSILASLEKQHRKVLVVEFNPNIVNKLKRQEVSVLFGDIADPEIQDKANIEKARLIISTTTDYYDNISLINAVGERNKRAKIIVAASSDLEALKLYDKGADYVMLPQFLSGLQMADLLRKDVKLKTLEKIKNRDLKLMEQVI